MESLSVFAQNTDGAASQSEASANAQVDFEFVSGKRVTSQLIWVPVEKQLYKKHSHYKKCATYRCYEKDCCAKVILNGNICSRRNGDHSHNDNFKLYKELQARTELKKNTVLNKTTEIRSIFNDVMTK